MKEFKITLDLVEQAKNESIFLKSDDLDSVKFIFDVKNDGEIYDLTGITSARLAIKNPLNIALFLDCLVTDGPNGICEVVLASQAYEAAGTNLGELYINEGGRVLVTRQFEYTSLGSVMSQNTAEDGTGTSGPVYWTDVLNKPTEFPPTIHNHDFASITDKPTVYPPDVHTHDFASITSKPTSYPPSAHTHAIEDVSGLSDSLAAKLEAIPAEYLTQTEGDNRYAPIGEVGGIEPPRTGTTDPTGAPDYLGQVYVNTTSGEAWVATTLTGGWQTISMDELGGGDSSVSWSSVTDKPVTFPPDTHNHAWTEITDKPTTFPSETHSHGWTEITGKPTAFEPTAHAHGITDITDLQGALDAKADDAHTHLWADITDKPAEFTPTAHTHDWTTGVTGKPTTFPPESHTHSYTELTNIPTAFTPAAHTHTEADVTFGAKNAKTYVDDADNYILTTVLDGLSLWSGTQLEYDNIITKDPKTLYFIVG
jgi:hypothetical protein